MSQAKWNLDPAHSAVHFSVRHMMFAKVRGSFRAWSAELTLDPEDLTRSRVSAELDAASIDTGVADRDNHLRSPDFLDAPNHPKIRFESRSIEPAGEQRYRVQGELEIRGTRHPITLEVEHLGGGKDPWGNQRVGFHAKGSLSRKQWGLTWNQALEAGGVLVGDQVEIEIEAQAVKTA